MYIGQRGGCREDRGSPSQGFRRGQERRRCYGEGAETGEFKKPVYEAIARGADAGECVSRKSELLQ